MPKKENPLRQLPASSDEYGTFKIHLAELMEQRGVSMNQLSFRTEIQRLDIDILKRLCYVLECDLNELIEYIPPKEI